MKPTDDFILSNNAELINVNLTRAIMKIIGNNELSKNIELSQIFQEKLNKTSIESALLIRPPCRFEIFHKYVGLTLNEEQTKYKTYYYDSNEKGMKANAKKVDIILDIAHNEAAMINFVRTVREVYGPEREFRIILGMCADKDILKSIIPLFNLSIDSNHFYCVEAKHPRAMKKENLQAIINDELSIGIDFFRWTKKPTKEFLSIRESVKHAICDAASNATITLDLQERRQQQTPVVLICGTAFIMDEIRAALGIIEPKDGDILFDLTNPNAMTDIQEHFKNN